MPERLTGWNDLLETARFWKRTTRFRSIWEFLLEELYQQKKLDTRLLVLDGTLIPSFDFRERVSYSGKHHTMGVKASIIVDATGIPLGVNIAPGSWNDMKLAAQPAITVPAVTLDGLADGNFPATDGSTSARHFTGPRVHHQVPNAGHNLPQEAPDAFASAVLELAHLRSQSAGV